MSASIIKKEKNIVTAEFAISKESFDKAVNEAYLKMRKDIAVQGFRKGKAPKHIIERKYGKSIFYDDAMDIALYEEYPKVLDELKLDPINRPKIDVKEFEEGKDLVFIAEIEVMPEVELGQYKGIEIEKVDYTVKNEDVDAEIKAIQEKNSRSIEVTDRAVKNGDSLTLDYSGFVGEEQFEGGTAQNQTLVIGSNTFIPGFEEQLIGKNIGEEVEVNVTFPEEYHAENLKGKEAVFKVTIHEIKEIELPELDDEFAKDVSEFDTLEELRADKLKSLEEKAKERERIETSNKIVEAIVGKTDVEAPAVLIEREIDYAGRNYEQQFRMQGFSGKEMDDLIANMVNQYKDSYKSQAEFTVKAELVVNAIIKAENIEASDEEIDAELKLLSEAYNIEEDKFADFKESMMNSSKEYIIDSIQKRKVLDLLISEAKFV